MSENNPQIPQPENDTSADASARNPGFIRLIGWVLIGDRSAWRKLRREVFEVIEVGRGENTLSRVFDAFIVTLIILNIAAFCAETVPSVEFHYRKYFHYFELFSVVVFTLEYVARLWTSIELPFLARMPPVQARLHFAKRPYMIIDLLAILPFYLAHVFGLDLRALRILRLIRFFKLSRYSPAMHTLIRVLSNERRSLSGAGLLLIAAVLLSATGMYYIEGREQPEKLGSVPLAAYWAITTLTTVGYGDISPVTGLGKMWAALTMVFGLCILALPVAIISTGFAQEAGRRDFVVTWSLMSRIPLLADLEASEVAQIMPLLHANELPPRFQIIGQGEPGDAMYFVASGHVELKTKNDTTRYNIGDFFGAVAMLEQDQSVGTFTTVDRSRLLKLHSTDFHRLEQINPTVGNHIRRVAAERRKAREVREQATAVPAEE